VRLNLGALLQRHEMPKAIRNADTHYPYLSLLLELAPLIVDQLQQYAVNCLYPLLSWCCPR